MKALMIAHVVFSVILIIVVLLQKSKQAGLSGAVAGGNDSFFGKNQGRTVDAMLKKLTGLFAVLFIVTSISLAYVSTRPEEPVAPAAETTAPVTDTTAPAADAAAEATEGEVVEGEAVEGEAVEGEAVEAETTEAE